MTARRNISALYYSPTNRLGTVIEVGCAIVRVSLRNNAERADAEGPG